MKKSEKEKLDFAKFIQELKVNTRRYLIFLCFLVVIILLPGQNRLQTLATKKINPSFVELPNKYSVVELYPKYIGIENPPFLTAQSAILLDAASQVVLYQKNENQKLKPASTTKIMTAVVALENYSLDDILEASEWTKEEITDASLMGLKSGEKVSVRSLLYGLLLNSGADAATTLANNYPGGKDEFVKAMNEKAKSLHLDNTNFSNVTGFDNDNLYTTVLDLARLTSYAIKNETFREIVGTREKFVFDQLNSHRYYLKNINQLLGMSGINGVKTGYTEQAGECLVLNSNLNNHDLISVVLKSENRFSESLSLIDWGYKNHEWIDLSYKEK